MSDEKNKLVKSIRPTVRQVGIHKQLEQAKAMPQASSGNPRESQHRIGIVFDDSGSMCGDPINKAKQAVSGFLRTCNPGNTSVAVYPLNADSKSLLGNYTAVEMYVQQIRDSGCTPLYATMKNMSNNEPITRAIVFSDGAPDWRDKETEKTVTIKQYQDKKIICDTVYIGPNETDQGAKELKEIAEKTGGIFMHFTNVAIFARNMKYLAPTNYGLLADPNFKNKVEKGTV